MNLQTMTHGQTQQTLGHVNLHYARAEDGPLAARLLEMIGLVKTQELELPTGTFYRFTVNRDDINRGDGIIYLSQLPPANAALFAAIRDTLRVGSTAEHPAVAAFHAAAAQDPEANFHVGFLVDSLEFIEERMEAVRTDPALSGRCNFLVNRALPGDPEIDARMDASPLYRDVTRYTYGRNGVQAFIDTDLIVSGPLAEGIVLELDYVFPGHENHILSVTEITR